MSGLERHKDEADPKEPTEVCGADDEGHMMVKAGQADHTRDTQKHESESNSHDYVEVKAESAKHKRPENLITLW